MTTTTVRPGLDWYRTLPPGQPRRAFWASFLGYGLDAFDFQALSFALAAITFAVMALWAWLVGPDDPDRPLFTAPTIELPPISRQVAGGVGLDVDVDVDRGDRGKVQPRHGTSSSRSAVPSDRSNIVEHVNGSGCSRFWRLRLRGIVRSCLLRVVRVPCVPARPSRRACWTTPGTC